MSTACPEVLGEAAKWASMTLSPSATASLDAQLILAFTLDRTRSWVIAHGDTHLTLAQREQLDERVRRRMLGEPIAYIRGWTDWADLRLRVNHHTLVPRPETEVVAERAVELAARLNAEVIADIGTGSGALAIFLAVSLRSATIHAVDVSADAIEIARQNAREYGVSERITFQIGGLLEPLHKQPDMVVANLPYLSDSMMSTAARDVGHEPRSALHGGPTGLELYGDMFTQMAERGWNMPLVLEIDARQASAMLDLLRERLPGGMAFIEPDLAGLDRVVVRVPDENYG